VSIAWPVLPEPAYGRDRRPSSTPRARCATATSGTWSWPKRAESHWAADPFCCPNLRQSPVIRSYLSRST